MVEERFEVPVGDGVLVGQRAESDHPALLLHGGPGMSDYTEGLAEELDGLFATIRYTQRGAPPSTVGPPYTVDSHMDDALAVLDHFELERVWAVGHSWGGHLALHLAVSHPERLHGIVCVNPLGPLGDVFDEFGQNLRRRLTDEEIAYVDEIEGNRREGCATDEDVLDRFRTLWPQYFPDPASAPEMVVLAIGAACSADTFASIAEHFQAGTLESGLPNVRLPALFVHGEHDPLPVRTAAAGADLVPGGVLEVLPGRGHFPWLEAPGEIRSCVERFLD